MTPNRIIILALPAMLTGCGILGSAPTDLPIETSVALTNLSRTMYVQFEIRPHDPGDSTDPYYATPLLAPGATHRRRFLDTLGDPCPQSLDIRVLLYPRVNADLPIGLDDGEQVEDVPLVAGEVFDVPACDGPVVETYTIVNWDAPPDTARVKIAQSTPVEALIRELGIFPNADAVWEVDGVDEALRAVPPQPLERVDPIEGRIVTADGSAVPDVGVLVRSRFRIRLADDDTANDPDAGFGDPIDFFISDERGAFRFDRPPGAYRVEAFSDELAFRPASTDVESPADTLLIIAEPIQP